MKEFILPMKKREKIAGWIYLPIHMFLMALIILPTAAVIMQMNGVTVDTLIINVMYYVIGFVYILIFMFSFLRESFTSAWRRGPFPTVLIGFGLYLLFNVGVNLILTFAGIDLINPNQQTVNEAAAMNAATMFAVAAIMAPVVEEVLFRGIVFGTIRKKNRILAYAISALLFAVYHLWSSAVASQDLSVLIYVVQYIPAGIILAWTYERCGSIWASILLHSAINALAIGISSTMG